MTTGSGDKLNKHFKSKVSSCVIFIVVTKNKSFINRVISGTHSTGHQIQRTCYGVTVIFRKVFT